MKSLIEKIRGLEVWVIALLVVAVLLIGFAASGYLSRWLGSVGQVATGALIGWVVSRRLMKLNVSQYTEPLHRCLAGLGQSLVISAGMIGVGVAV
jgi:uncharacterized membrane protein (DUF4010 family)